MSRLYSKKRGDYLGCDATDPREGHDWGAPCNRRVTIEVVCHLTSTMYVMHYCKRHESLANEKPRCVISQTTREVN